MKDGDPLEQGTLIRFKRKHNTQTEMQLQCSHDVFNYTQIHKQIQQLLWTGFIIQHRKIGLSNLYGFKPTSRVYACNLSASTTCLKQLSLQFMQNHTNRHLTAVTQSEMLILQRKSCCASLASCIYEFPQLLKKFFPSLFVTDTSLHLDYNEIHIPNFGSGSN